MDQGLPCLAAIAASLLSTAPPALSRREEKEVRNRTCVLAKPSQAAEATRIRSGPRVESGSVAEGPTAFKVSRAETQAKKNTPVHASTCAGLFLACGEVGWNVWLCAFVGGRAWCRTPRSYVPHKQGAEGASVDKRTRRHNNEKTRMAVSGKRAWRKLFRVIFLCHRGCRNQVFPR